MSTDKPALAETSTIRGDEVARFDRLAATWWNSEGPMRPLHVINGLRLGYLLEQIAARFGRPVGDLQGLRIADIGCGAGLMCEPLAARGARVVGVDAAAKNIAAAKAHASHGEWAIDYRIGEPEAALRGVESFDVLLLLEVVEHVDNVAAFVRDAARHLRPGGLLLASTINRTPRSFLTAIVGAEYIFRALPRGTHRWAQFVRPDELNEAALACGLTELDRRGMGYLPVVHRAWWTRDVSVNYIASFTRGAAAARIAPTRNNALGRAEIEPVHARRPAPGDVAMVRWCDGAMSRSGRWQPAAAGAGVKPCSRARRP